MKRALKAEFRKLRFQRSTYGILATATAISVVSAISIVAAAQMPRSGMFMDLTSQTTMRTVMGSAASGYLFALILGIVMSTTEYRHSTAVATYLAQPRRTTVMYAKMVAAAVAGFVLQLISTAVAMVAGLMYAGRYPHFTLPMSDYTSIMAGALLTGVVLAIMGVAVGMLIRSQMVAVVLAMLWLQLIEGLLLVFADWLGKWSITGAINSVLQVAVETPEVSMTSSDLLTPWQSVFLLLAYGALFAAVAVRTTMRRDVD